MAISEKDRSQLLRMAGNIAGSIIMGLSNDRSQEIAEVSVRHAIAIMQEVDRKIEEQNHESPS